LKRQREVLAECLDKYPEYLIGHEVHKFVPEWNAVARGRIIKYDANETWWIVKYDADHKTSDFDKEQVLKYAINREDGESEPDGGLAAMLRYKDKPSGNFNIRDSDGSPEDASVPGSGGDSTNLLALASPRCSKPRPGLSPDAFRARISWARLSDPSDIARLMPHICPVAAACARGRGSGAIIAEPSQRSLSRER
jgi:hypothetical protein